MLQKTAKVSAPVKGSEITNANANLKGAAKKTRALLRSLKPLSLKARRNKVLDHAIKMFSRDDGWIKGSLQRWSAKNGYTAFCAIGAIKDAEGPKTAKQAAVDALFASLPKRFQNGYFGESSDYGYVRASGVVSFNDTSTTRKTQILNVFKKAKKQPLRKD